MGLQAWRQNCAHSWLAMPHGKGISEELNQWGPSALSDGRCGKHSLCELCGCAGRQDKMKRIVSTVIDKEQNNHVPHSHVEFIHCFPVYSV